MIIFIVGGHGSGKSTLIRKLVKDGTEDWIIKDRRASGYLIRDKTYVVGDYNKKFRNGGADGVRPLAQLAKLVETRARKQMTVVLEGIGQAGIQRHIVPLIRKYGGAVLHITTDVKDCYKGVHDRGHTLSMEGVRRGCVRAANIAKFAAAQDVSVVECNRGNAARKLRETMR